MSNLIYYYHIATCLSDVCWLYVLVYILATDSIPETTLHVCITYSGALISHTLIIWYHKFMLFNDIHSYFDVH